MSTHHVLAVPFPAQGHVIPLLEFSQYLAKHGFRITFVNSEYNHKRVLKSLEGKNYIEGKIHLVSIPDGTETWEDRNDWGKLVERMLQVMPGKLEELIEDFNTREDEKIACVIADVLMGWAIQLAQKMKIRRTVFNTASAASLALTLTVAKLIDDGIVNNYSTPINQQMNQLIPYVLPMNSENYLWALIEALTSERIFLQQSINIIKAVEVAEHVICNSTYDLESTAFTLVPKLLPVGPLLASNRLGNSAGHFWTEDSTCLNWLDQQQPNSVIYVAFGSLAVFDKIQFQELALGLELCNRPFLWVVRTDFTNDVNNAYPDGFIERVATRGQILSWAPQQKVLSHHSIGCFLSHCGWNSTMEGVRNGVPFLCWPYFYDQLLNESYICDVWKVGLKFNRNESGIITKEEIKSKIDQVLGDDHFKAKALDLKEKTLIVVREGGSSNKAIKNVIEWIKTGTAK